jgi:hypothetical protein
MLKLNPRKAVFLLCAVCLMTALAASAQTFTTFATLNGANNGSQPCPAGAACPEGSLAQGADGNLYGTTYANATLARATKEGI